MEEYSERSYTINLEIINRLRKQHGLSWEKLAEKALVHVTTLRAWRKGRPAFLGSIKRLADALGADVKDLVNGWQDDIPQEDPKSPSVRDYDVKIDEGFANWDKEKQDKFLEGLRLILATGSEVRVMGKADPGCVKLRLRLTPEQAEKLERAFDTGELKNLKIIEISPTLDPHDRIKVSIETILPLDVLTPPDACERFVSVLGTLISAENKIAILKSWESRDQYTVTLQIQLDITRRDKEQLTQAIHSGKLSALGLHYQYPFGKIYGSNRVPTETELIYKIFPRAN